MQPRDIEPTPDSSPWQRYPSSADPVTGVAGPSSAATPSAPPPASTPYGTDFASPTAPSSAPYGAQPYGESGYGAQPYGEVQPYGGSAYGGSAYGAQPYGVQPYGVQPYAQPYGVQTYTQYPEGVQKSRVAAGLLAIFLGTLGIHNFYLGRTGLAVAQLLISVLSLGILAAPVAIWALIEGILILTKSPSFATDAKGIPLRD